MRKDFRAYLLGTVCMAASIVSAQAGGLVEPMSNGFKDGGYTPMGGSLKDGPILAPAISRWYVRGDIGYTRYGNVGGYIGEHQQYVGENTIDANGNLIGDFNGDCRLDNNDLQYNASQTTNVDSSFVYANGNPVVDANGNLLDPNGNNILDGNGNPRPASSEGTVTDGFAYFNNTNGSSNMRFRASNEITSVGGNQIYQTDANGQPVETGTWQRYDAATGQWVNAARAVDDGNGNMTYEVWDGQAYTADAAYAAANGGNVLDANGNPVPFDPASYWGAQDANGDNYTASSIVDVVRTFARYLPQSFLDLTTGPDSGREFTWLQSVLTGGTVNGVTHTAAGRSTCTVGRNTLAKVDIDDTWMIGGGIGYNFNRHWRGDLTFDYRFKSDVAATDKFLDVWGTTAMSATHSTELSSFVTLANLYYDFGNRSGFSPYVGAGLGFSVNRLADRAISCEFESGPNAGQDCGGGTAYGAGDSNLSVAAAAMVGFSQAMSSNMKLDVGYRFLYMGDANSANDLSAADGGSQGQLVLEDITAHELRVGLRYEFGGR